MSEDKFQGGMEVESNWFKFEHVGDGVKGTLIAKNLVPSSDAVFPDQWVYEIQDENGEIINVGISVKKVGTISRLNKCKIGEIIGIIFEKEIPAEKKGFAATKVLKVFTWGMNPEYNQMTGGEEIYAD